jgi:hypothetical protein
LKKIVYALKTTPIHQKLTIKKRTLFALILKKRSGKIWQQKQGKN